VHGSGLADLEGDFDLVITNPPYIAGEGKRTYRDGGPRGTELGLGWVEAAAGRLRPLGRIILYTGSPISEGVDPVKRFLEQLCEERRLDLAYEELDPDVFGGSLRQEAYRTWSASPP
jgi:release factor glutamine methyltransferase